MSFFIKGNDVISTVTKERYSLTITKIWIGCEAEGTEVTTEDVYRVINEYYKLNPKK
jgi:hypothetical protein